MGSSETTTSRSENQQKSAAPSISPPKGGGAIRGVGEKFAANPVTGTGSMTMPIATSPGRSGFGPQLSLSYDSGTGNGPFGFGWSLSIPSITRKTDKGLPRYRDADESDVFILSGAEDLVPVLVQDGGNWAREMIPPRTVDGKTYRIQRYRPRIEGLFARIERWTNQAHPADSFWRSITKDNITTWYGKTAESRLVDPADPTHIFNWLICESHDDEGNAIVYGYKEENSDGVDVSQAHERNRTDQTRAANRYLKRIKYGNRTPYHPIFAEDRPPTPPPSEWLFEAVFDYGEYDPDTPAPEEPGRKWSRRNDPFSSYRAGFEVRTYRLCRRVLMFHHFPNEQGVGANCLVRSTDFTYSHEEDPDHARKPVYTFLRAVTESGYRRHNDGYLKRSLPPVEFEYTEPIVQDTVEEVDRAGLENLPVGLDGAAYQWTDLHGEGIPGILSEQGGAWFYKRNLSPIGKYPVEFGPLERVACKPNLALTTGARFMDLAGDGRPDLVVLDGPSPGLYEHDGVEGWQPFRPFTARLNRDMRDPNLKFVDLDGDGHADALITEDDAFVWHASLAEEGFGPARRVAQALDEEKGPRLVFADGTQSVYLADLSGDGLTDLVRIRNGEVCYWPNLGYGRFGAKVTMDHAPHFDHPDQFDQRRLRLADIDGTGTTDIIYLHRDGACLYFNQSGNGWSEPQVLRVFPRVDDLVGIVPIDLLGNGTACLVWSSPLPGDAGRQMRYVNLMGRRKPDQGVQEPEPDAQELKKPVQKPHLLVSVKNNLGAETRVRYAPSTKFYLQDKRDGKPWITRLPFPVHVVERVETYDRISRNRFVTRYAYHHGYFDGVEREFRGFGMVEQWDTEEIAALTGDGTSPDATNADAASHVPPVHTKTWFHTGVYLDREHISRQFEDEYYREPGLSDSEFRALLLPDTTLPTGLTPDEEHEACRALKGVMLRREVYADDAPPGSPEAMIRRAGTPYTVVEQDFTIRILQRRAGNRHAVFFTHPREAITYHYERNPVDPRIQHALTLEVDDFANVLKEAAIGYGRRRPDATLPLQADRDKQTQTLITYTENHVTYTIEADDAYRTPLPCESRTYELTGYTPTGAAGRFQSADFVQPDPADPDGVKLVHIAGSEIQYEDQPTTGTQRRLIEHVRTLYRKDDLTALLPLGEVEPLALPGESYQLAFTPGVLAQVFQHNGQPLLPNPAAVLDGRSADGGGYLNSQALRNQNLFPPDSTHPLWTQSDEDDYWWIPAGRVFLSPDGDHTAAPERAYAQSHFFLPHRYQDPFGQTTTVTYDPYDLLMLETRDALGNRVTVGERRPDGTIDSTKPGNDYRVLQPSRVMDPNRNRTQAAFDALGMVVGTAVMGKPEETLGDALDGFNADLTNAEILDHLADPLTDPHAILDRATTRLVYDLSAYRRTKNQPDPQPAVVYILAREIHDADLEAGRQTKMQHSFSYSDGFGREIQQKIQAEAGPAPKRAPEGKIIVGPDGRPEMTDDDVSPRWVGSGWTIFNNKGKPVRQYEPFFSSTHRFEFGVQVGVSPILFYDPVERVVATLHPNRTYEKVVFDPWRQTTWDVNDTVLGDPRTDADIRGCTARYFAGLPAGPPAPPWQTWHVERQGGALGVQEQAAADKAAAHADTPATAYFDTLGRPFLTVTHNKVACANHVLDGTEDRFHTRVELDIEGNQRAVRDAIEQNGDALGRIVMRYAYDMPGNRIHQAGMEAGERRMLNDVAGNPIRAWDSRGHTFRTEYDPLRRPVRVLVTGADPANPNQELLTERLVYGEHHPEAEQRNLRGRLYLHLDQAGAVTGAAHDFKGNLLRASRRIATEYKQAINWSAVDAALPVNATDRLNPGALEASLAPLLEAGTYTSRTTYDGLNRPVQLIVPRSDQPEAKRNVLQPGYNEANLLERVDVWLDHPNEPVGLIDAAVTRPAAVGVSNIDYDAKGRRLRIDYKNGTTTRYTYDPQTFRLIHLYTRRGASFTEDCGSDPPPPRFAAPDVPPPHTPCGLQNLRYTYDPVGNITHIRDDAQQSVYFRNKRVEPSAGYTYDALYRLIEATGREHLGQDGGAPIPHSHNDAPRVGLLSADAAGRFSPNDGGTLGTYIERYVYDAVGNFLEMRHRGSDPAHPGWLRTYAYDEAGLIEPGKQSNRLSGTAVGNGNPGNERYVHDAHGNMIRMPHLGGVHPAPNMHWDYKDQLRRTDLGGGGTAYYTYDAAGRRLRKVWEKSANLVEERIYLGGFEIYRRRQGAERLERETLHIMDDRRRIALVETRTLDTAGNDPAPARLIRYQFGNHLGSVSLELDEQARIISYEEYYPYGGTSYQAVRRRTETPKRYRYTGKERDEESGFYYHGARYYASWLGRWTSCDPAGLLDGLSVYEYVRSNPIRNVDPNGMQHWNLERGTPDDPVVAGCIGSVCYLNIRQSKFRELQRRAGVQRELQTGAAIASNPFSALLWGIARLLTDDPNKQHAAAQAGLAIFGLAGAGAAAGAGRQQMRSVGQTPPQRPVAAEVRTADPPTTRPAPPPPTRALTPPRGQHSQDPPARPTPTPRALPRGSPPPAAPPPGRPSQRPQSDVLVVGAETSAEFAYARRVSQQGGNVTVVNPRATAAARSYRQSGGNFVQGRVEDLPAGARFNLIREDYPFPLGRAFIPTQQFVQARLGRLKPGGTWVVVTESAEFVQALRAAGTSANARVTVHQIPRAHEATPQSTYPREENRFVVTFSR